MAAPPVPPPVTPPAANNSPPGSNHRIQKGSLVFFIGMFLTGLALFISKVTGFSPGLNTPTPFPAAASNLKGTALAATVHREVTPKPSPTEVKIIKVFVTGEVINPGVYQMDPEERVEDAIQKAGGFSGNADKNRLDLAQRVKDEMQIVVPALPLTRPSAPGFTATPPGGITVPPTGKPTAEPKPSGTARQVKIVNLNSASLDELESLPGIGPVLSQRIIDYRVKNGPFKSVEDLKKVQGLNKSVFDKIKDLVEV